MDRWRLGEDESLQVKQLLDECSDESLLKLSVDAHAIAAYAHHGDSLALDSDLVARFNRLKNPPPPPATPKGPAPAAAIAPRLPIPPVDPVEVDILGADLAARLAALKAPAAPSVASSKSSVFASANPSALETLTSTDSANKSKISARTDAATASFGSAKNPSPDVAPETLDSRNEEEASAGPKDCTPNGNPSEKPTESVAEEKRDSGNEEEATAGQNGGTATGNPSGQHSPQTLTHNPDQMSSRSCNAEATYDSEVQNLLASIGDQIRLHGKGSHGMKPAETTSEPCSEDEISDREVDEMVEWAKDAARLDDGEEEDEEEGLEVQEDDPQLSVRLPPVSSTTLQPVKKKGRGWKFWQS